MHCLLVFSLFHYPLDATGGVFYSINMITLIRVHHIRIGHIQVKKKSYSGKNKLEMIKSIESIKKVIHIISLTFSLVCMHRAQNQAEWSLLSRQCFNTEIDYS